MSNSINKKLLFITWDGPQTTYMEGLFMPIFRAIAQKKNIDFHVIQFTWGNKERVAVTEQKAKELGIVYKSITIRRRPVAILGSIFTMLNSFKKLKQYIEKHKIDIVMPRSTFPAMMINRIKKRNFKLLFDADGLPLEEKVDFAGLKKASLQYKLLKADEIITIKNSDVVITRSAKSINIHLQFLKDKDTAKFAVVSNGKDPDLFKLDPSFRDKIRGKLEIDLNTILFIYSGSLGPQYGLNEMFEIFENVSAHSKCHLLILTGNRDFAEKNIPKKIKSAVSIRTVSPDIIPEYLNAADIAFAIRQPTFSMQGVAPIKLGEYLLCGLPVIASKGIGDTEEILSGFEECFMYDNNKSVEEQIIDIRNFIMRFSEFDKNKIRKKAIPVFSLEASVNSYINALEKLGI